MTDCVINKPFIFGFQCLILFRLRTSGAQSVVVQNIPADLSPAVANLQVHFKVQIILRFFRPELQICMYCKYFEKDKKALLYSFAITLPYIVAVQLQHKRLCDRTSDMLVSSY